MGRALRGALLGVTVTLLLGSSAPAPRPLTPARAAPDRARLAWEQVEQRLRAFSGTSSLLEAQAPGERLSVSAAGLALTRTGAAAPLLTLTPARVEGLRPGPARLAARGPIATVDRGALLESYENRADGVEHTITVRERPAAALRVQLGAEGLTARASAAGQIELLDAAGSVRREYRGLSVVDARGTPLAARLLVEGEAIAIAVEDRAAVYPVTIDPLLSTPEAWSPVQSSGGAFGVTITGADLNGDGFSDIVIGAPSMDGEKGAIYAYFGHAEGPTNSQADWTVTGEAAGDHFGAALAAAGDVDGDGVDDLVVGAPDAAPDAVDAGVARGKAYLFLGKAKAKPSTTAAWKVVGEVAGDRLGFSVAGAGDMNGDGVDDLLLGAPYAQAEKGKFYLYAGRRALPPLTAATFAVVGNVGERLGWVVASAGDLDGDGKADAAVGAPLYTDNSFGTHTAAGRVALFMGRATGDPAAATSLVGDSKDQSLGASLAAGDFNGDGLSDLVVSACPQLAGGFGCGTGTFASLFLGRSSGLNTNAKWTSMTPGSQANAGLGEKVALAGDVNGDGYADLYLAAPRWNYATTEKGAAFIFEGGPGGFSATPSSELRAPTGATGYASGGGGVGDVNGDGLSDVVVGASLSSRAFLYTGAAGPPEATPSWNTSGPGGASSNFGASVASAGDVNGDGLGDVLVGSPLADGKGHAYLFLGQPRSATPTTTTTTPDWIGSGAGPNAEFATSVAGAGDLNGDGFADVVVGAPGDGPGGTIYVYFGSAKGIAANAVPWKYACPTAGDRCGIVVGGAGDVNGDTFADLFVGASSADGRGKVLVFHGASGGPGPAPAFTVSGPDTGGNTAFATQIAGGGDLDGDGFSDLLVGAPLADGGAGRVYLWFGSAKGLSGPLGASRVPPQGKTRYGTGLAIVGDVDGDGIDDWVVGAPATGNVAGYAELILGDKGRGVSALASWAASGTVGGDLFGATVAAVGDLNGDRHADFLVGSPGFPGSSPKLARGQVQLFLGPAAKNAPASWQLRGTDESGFAKALAGAGDFDGDGYPDLLIGSPEFSTTGAPGVGRASLVRGNEGRALPLSAQQTSTDGSRSIAPLCSSLNETGATLRLAGGSLLGKAPTRLVWEVKPATLAFNGEGLDRTPASLSPPVLTTTLAGLTPGSLYHWRARLGFRAGLASHWVTATGPQGGGIFRAAPLPGPDAGLPDTGVEGPDSGATSDAGTSEPSDAGEETPVAAETRSLIGWSCGCSSGEGLCTALPLATLFGLALLRRRKG